MEQEEKNMQLFELVQALLYQSDHKPHMRGGRWLAYEPQE